MATVVSLPSSLTDPLRFRPSHDPHLRSDLRHIADEELDLHDLVHAATRGFHDEIRAENVRGHEVGRELDAAEAEIEDFAERADEQRLAEAGHAFEQHMPAAKQRDEGALDDGFVADDDFADFGLERGVGVAEGLDLGFGAHGL